MSRRVFEWLRLGLPPGVTIVSAHLSLQTLSVAACIHHNRCCVTAVLRALVELFSDKTASSNLLLLSRRTASRSFAPCWLHAAYRPLPAHCVVLLRLLRMNLLPHMCDHDNRRLVLLPPFCSPTALGFRVSGCSARTTSPFQVVANTCFADDVLSLAG